MPTGVIKFSSVGDVDWRGDPAKNSSWHLNDDGTVLGTTFVDVYHKFKYDDYAKQAVMIRPRRNPSTTMKMQIGTGMVK